MFAVNVRAVFAAVQAAVGHMGAGGRIITLGSVTADRSGFPGASVYSMTKAAVAALTRGSGTRPRITRHHGQYGAARADGDGHE
jgi:NAD(P)-dependent dehydrogenase (short-subunit alcohol dehydrogenase family)